MDNQNETNETIKKFFRDKGYILEPMQHHFWSLSFEGQTRIIKIGKTPHGQNEYRKQLANQNIKTWQIKTMEQAKKVIGIKPKPSQAERFLILLKERGKMGVDADIAKEAGVNNVSASALVLKNRGYNLLKIPRKGYNADSKDDFVKMVFIYLGKTKKMEI